METKTQPKRIVTDTIIRAILSVGYSEEMTLSQLSRDLNVTFSHIHKRIVPTLVEWGCFEVVPDGRQKLIHLTPTGQEIFKRLEEIGELLDGPISMNRDRRIDLITSEVGTDYENTN